MIRPSTQKRQYQQYLERFAKLEKENLIKSYMDASGKVFFEKPLSEKAFINSMNRALKIDPELSRYTYGKDLAQSQAQFTDKQLHYFRTEVLLNLDNINKEDADSIRQIMRENQTTKSYWSATDFRRNARDIMDYFFGGGGKKYLSET